MKKNILVKGIVSTAIVMSVFSSIANAGIVDDIRKECSNYSESVTKDPNSALNKSLKDRTRYNCISVEKLDDKKQGDLKDALLQKQQERCLQVVQNQCQMKLSADDGSKCVLHKDSAGVEDYAIFYNEDKKLFSTIKGLKNYSCSIDQTTVSNRVKPQLALAQTKVIRGNLFLVTDGRVMFFDDSGTLRELLSNKGNSYKLNGAFVQALDSADGGRTLTIVRRYSENTDKTQDIEVPSSVLDDSSRTEVVALDKVNKQTIYLRDGNDLIPVKADVIK